MWWMVLSRPPLPPRVAHRRSIVRSPAEYGLKIIICMHTAMFAREDGCIQLCCESKSRIASLENQLQDSNKSCNSASGLTLEQDLGRM